MPHGERPPLVRAQIAWANPRKLSFHACQKPGVQTNGHHAAWRSYGFYRRKSECIFCGLEGLDPGDETRVVFLRGDVYLEGIVGSIQQAREFDESASDAPLPRYLTVAGSHGLSVQIGGCPVYAPTTSASC